LARFIGERVNATLNSSWDTARRSRATVRESLPENIGRAANRDPAANSCENFTFHGHRLWEMCRYDRFMVELDTGRRTLTPPLT